MVYHVLRGGYSSMVRALPCGGRGCAFDSRYPPWLGLHIFTPQVSVYNPVMAQEIEMNFIVKDKNGLLAFLKSQGKETLSEIKMTYLGKSADDSFYIRIEEIKDDKGERKFLTAKGNFKSENGVNQRKEVTLPLEEDPQKYVEFFTLIGMELSDSKQKVRHQFLIDNLQITLDEWNVVELGDRLEIEGESDELVKAFSEKIKTFCDPVPSK